MKTATPSQTAERVALTRAIESLQPDGRRICTDPWARYFLSGRMQRMYRHWPLRLLFCFMSDRHVPGVRGAVLLRTRFMDDFLAEQMDAGISQVVNLGAGYDTRALRFRSSLKGATVFEIDHPATQQRKTAVLRARFGPLPSNLVFVPARFNSENTRDRLMAAGYRPDQPTVFIWEGVTYYLSPRAVDNTLKLVADASGAGSTIVFDFFPPSVADGTSNRREARGMRAFFEKLGEALTFGVFPDRMPGFLMAKGFSRVRILSSGDLRKKYLSGCRRNLKVSEIFFIARARAK